MSIEKHTTYFNLLDALKEKGCPFCRLADKSVHNYFDAFLFENVTDHEVSKKLMKAKGFCKVHSKKFLEFNDALAAALVYEALIYDMTEAEGLSLKSLSPKETCPACLVEKESEERNIDTFRDFIISGDSDIKTAYLASDGICLAHLKDVLLKIKDREALGKIIEKEQKLLQGLRIELLEFIRKNDYRFSKEEWGKEKDSWRRTVAKFVGNDSMKEKRK